MWGSQLVRLLDLANGPQAGAVIGVWTCGTVIFISVYVNCGLVRSFHHSCCQKRSLTKASRLWSSHQYRKHYLRLVADKRATESKVRAATIVGVREESA